ncbi:hypothetical protein [Mesoterricola sediminis]|uniref:Uncharacterized protein n=1 Tax=Mesoterricola sediminis TaxID=2927980 RepID=A0AA48H3L5_9BACT|nr:hypothetical protein [Mesoterricola sediminis]BDU76846.1 hypothetical protein METESE_18040 [Mesoterricola sediminis]
MRALLLLAGLALGAQVPSSGELTPAQAAAFWQRIGGREPFLESAEARSEPQSLYRFFQLADYLRLQGNPSMGHFADSGFRWTGTRVAWLGVRPVTPDAAPITARAWDAAFRFLAKRRQWILDRRAPIRIRGACVGAVLEPTPGQPFRGVCIELRLESPEGTLLYRYSVAKPSIEDAVGAALDWVLCCAGGAGQEVPHGAS